MARARITKYIGQVKSFLRMQASMQDYMMGGGGQSYGTHFTHTLITSSGNMHLKKTIDPRV